MPHTPGPWALRGYQIRADNGTGAHVATYQISKEDGALIAAAPAMLALLQVVAAELDSGPRRERREIAGFIFDRLVELGLKES